MKETMNSGGDPSNGVQLMTYKPQNEKAQKDDFPPYDNKNSVSNNPHTEAHTQDVKIAVDSSAPEHDLDEKGNSDSAHDKQDSDEAVVDPQSSASTLSTTSSMCCVYRLHYFIRRFVTLHRGILLKIILALLFVGYLAYFGYCMYYKFGDEPSVRLLVLTIIVVLVVFHKVGKRFVKCSCWSRVDWLFDDGNKRGLKYKKIIRWTLYALSVFGVLAVLIAEVILKQPENLISLAGLVFLMVISFFISAKPEKINWHAVFWGMMLQFWFAVLIRKTTFGSEAFEWLADRIVEFLKHTDAGSKAVFGEKYIVHRFVFAVMPTLIFFNAMISLMYYLGLIQIFIATFGKFLSFCIGTSPIESVNAAANLFLTVSEAPILIKPFMKDVTSSELFAILTGGFASIAGSLLWAFAAYGAPIEHILTASVMSAPAALAFAKLMYPDDRKPTIKAEDAYGVDVSHYGSLLGALSSGAKDGLRMAGYVVVNLLIYVALLEFLDHTLLWFTERAGVEGFSFSKLVAYIFYPVTYLMGFPADDCFQAARLLGIKILTTTTQTFIELGIIITNGKELQSYTETYNGTWRYVGDDIFLEATNTTLVGGVLSEKAGILATYMICGLSNLGAIGVAIGAFASVAPTRTREVIATVPLALLAGNFASFSTACVAGLLQG